MVLNNKVILITGASSGIGYELSKLLTEKGAKVICFSKSIPKSKINGVLYFKVDVTNQKSIQNALRKTNSKIDIMINNAGIIRRGTLFDTSEEEFDLLFDVNVKGSWLMIKLSKPYLKKDATIVQMSSRHGANPQSNPGIYALTKQADINLAELLKRTAPNYSVKVLCPGPVDTAIARYGVKGKALKEKLKLTHQAKYVAEKILKVLEDDKEKLIFNPKTWDYEFE